MTAILVVVLRSCIAFFSLLIVVRLMGKQQLSELNFFDYVVGITIGSLAATLSVQLNESPWAALTGVLVWAVLAIFISFLSIHSVWFRKVITGEATIVISNGKILEKSLKRLRISLDELMALLRAQGIFNLNDVEFALFEANGKLSVQKRSQKRPLTPEDLNLSTAYEGLPTTLVQEGVVLTQALRSLNLSRSWLMAQLNRAGVKEIQDISLAQLDTMGNLYIDLMGDETPLLINVKGGEEQK